MTYIVAVFCFMLFGRPEATLGALLLCKNFEYVYLKVNEP